MNVGDARRAWDLLETVASDVAPVERRLSAIDQLTDLLGRVRQKEVALAAREAEVAAKKEEAAKVLAAAKEEEAARRSRAAREEEEFARRFRATRDWFE